jgi:hypothetical protein
MTKHPPVRCMECGAVAELVAGSEVYPHRRDLWKKFFFRCVTPSCNSLCGCHSGTKRALGRPAGPALRNARQATHAVVDPLWRFAIGSYAIDPADRRAVNQITARARSRVYTWLADGMSIRREDCHIALFTIEQCRVAYRLARSTTYEQIREWARPREAVAREQKGKAA